MTEVEESNPPFATFIKKFYVTFQLENSIPLKDGRFAAGSRDFYGFGIYNPANASHCEIMIRTNSSVLKIVQLDSGYIAITTDQDGLLVYSISEDSYELKCKLPNNVKNIVALSKNRCATYHWINANKFTVFDCNGEGKILYEKEGVSDVQEIVEAKNVGRLLVRTVNGLEFYDLDTGNLAGTIDDISSIIDSIEIDTRKVLLSSYEGRIYIIDAKECRLLLAKKYKTINSIKSFMKVDDSYVLVELENKFGLLNVKTKKFRICDSGESKGTFYKYNEQYFFQYCDSGFYLNKLHKDAI